MIGVFIITKRVKIGISVGVIVVIAVLLGALGWYQKNHFNKNVTINGIKVGGLTAKQALNKLKNLAVDNTVYLGDEVLYRGTTTSGGFSNTDLTKVQKALNEQFSLWPSAAKKNLQLNPSQADDYRETTLRQAVKETLTKQNETRTKAVDAYAQIKNGQVQIIAAKKGNQYDVAKIMKQYDQAVQNKKIHLKSVFLQPLTAKSPTVKKEKAKLKRLLNQEVNYVVQKTTYKFASNDYLDGTTYNTQGYQFVTTALSERINQINSQQATLGKTFTFKTSTGKTINVQGETYGWALDTSKAAKSICQAFEDGTATLDAKADIYGKGYLTYGTGYDALSNDGIGDTYAEVSLADQHIWLYKDGQQVLSYDVVTGNASTNEQTPTGVYYIMYKQSPSTLKGTHSDGQHYEVKVNYWAQFTNSGCGFHDASWRTNWNKDAYLTNGSGGCVNILNQKKLKAFMMHYLKKNP